MAAERLDHMQDPELSIEQAVADHRRLGYSVVTSLNANDYFKSI